MKYLGCAYYPEYWGRERVETDAVLMKDAGINLVRIGEFAWSRMEPEEGCYALDWLHECIKTLGRFGIDVMLCTPTATPPVWLTSAYPDTLLVKPDGRRMEHGGRRHYCYSSDTYRRHTVNIVEKLTSEFSVYPNVIAWQIDNEPDFGETGICYCEQCQAGFQAWLKQTYGSVAELNRAWGTGFWSMDYTDWRQIRLAGYEKHQYSSRKLDTRRFASHMLSDFVLMQADMIRKYQPQTVISTNLNGDIFTGINYNRLFGKLDLAYKDLYFDICTMDTNALIMNQCRSFKPGLPYWVTETGAGAIDYGRPAHAGQFKAWMWSSFAHGADAHVVFRWRTCLSGQEQELQGILEHSGKPLHRYRAVRDAFLEMKEWSARLGKLPLPEADVAIIHDYDVKWAYESSVIGKDIHYDRNLRDLHQVLYRKNLVADVVPANRELLQYKLVILPSLMIVNEELAGQLRAFLQKGGVVLAQGQLGLRDRNANYLSEEGPDRLQEVFGIRVAGGMYLYSQVAPDEAWFARRRDFTVQVSGALNGSPVAGRAATWLADMEADTAAPLLTVMEDTYQGQPAVVENKWKNGHAIYAGAVGLDDGLLEELFDYALNKAGIFAPGRAPEHVEIIRRGNILFAVNHRNEFVEVELDVSCAPLKGTLVDNKAHLGPFEVALLKVIEA